MVNAIKLKFIDIEIMYDARIPSLGANELLNFVFCMAIAITITGRG
ncbi:hypothetical protein RINTU1_25700 [Candidatus Regiella insecticola]|uniref:Uncharacterized protein n=1 Tax=Candidatus Regiella insecticola TaxID=138073 RepID=A0A6L2ZQS7_9ENTR|nr:hypothetical protein RINTU1_25700 [Candidatus Regiella insecticola]